MRLPDKMFDLQGKTVIVTGATGQLGRAICEAFVLLKCRVVGIDVSVNAGLLDAVEYKQADVTKSDELYHAIEEVIKTHGRADVLINNAGVSCFEPFERRPEDKIDWVMDVNLKGTFFCIQNYVNLYDKYGLREGTIVNIASHYGVISPDFRIYTDCDRKNSEIYGATKAGIIQMTRYFAVHLADRNIRVNCVSPGGIFNPDNPQGEDFKRNYAFRCPMKRMANAEEILGGIIYLASPAASYTTGHNIIIDGGMSCW